MSIIYESFVNTRWLHVRLARELIRSTEWTAALAVELGMELVRGLVTADPTMEIPDDEMFAAASQELRARAAENGWDQPLAEGEEEASVSFRATMKLLPKEPEDESESRIRRTGILLNVEVLEEPPVKQLLAFLIMQRVVKRKLVHLTVCGRYWNEEDGQVWQRSEKKTA